MFFICAMRKILFPVREKGKIKGRETSGGDKNI